jgi:hypothetical protein
VSSRGKVTFGQYRAMRSGGTSVPSAAWYVVDSQGFALGPTRCDAQTDAAIARCRENSGPGDGQAWSELL